MARIQSIKPFPPEKDRNHFGSWLSGFVDGEGSFYLAWQGNKESPTTGIARFGIGLRRDDRPVLELIQSYWECGNVNDVKPNPSVKNARPTSSFRIAETRDLVRIVIPHFEKFPLQAKKAGDYLIWKRAVYLLDRIKRKPYRGRRHIGCGLLPKWTPQEKEEFQDLVDAIRSNRRFDTPHQPVPESREAGNITRQGFMFDI